MTETPAPVVPIRPGLAARYGDTQAMNDIRALVTGFTLLTGDETAACVAEIITRTGRRLDPARTITAETTSDKHGTPVARVDADGTVVLVCQDPDGPGALIQVTTRNPAEAAGLIITVDGRLTGRSPARPVRPVTGRTSRRPLTGPDRLQPGGPVRKGRPS